MTTPHTVGDGPDSITYDVHGDLADATPASPALLLFGSPMEAAAFGTLASHFADRVVVTIDPRGAGRNPTDTTDLSPEDHADDLHRVVEALGTGPVDAFGTSGGGVNLLRLLELHPDDVRIAVVHEPATATGLPDRDVVLAALDDMKATYAAAGEGPAMAKFIGFVMHDGEFTREYLERPDPDPAMFGMSTDDDGGRTSPLMRNAPACTLYAPDTEALRRLGDRLVLAYGEESGRQFACRGAHAVAAAVGLEPTEFPSHHGGFVGDGPGHPSKPAQFAARLREVLDGRSRPVDAG